MNNFSRKHRPDAGFTIIELLIATAIFSVVLIIFLMALIRISEIFYKGVNMSNTQETARKVLQDIADDVQLFQQTPYVPPGANYFCIGNHRYIFTKGVQVGSGKPVEGIIRQVESACSTPGPTPTGEQLLNPGMQLNDLAITPLNNGVQIRIFIVYYGSDNGVFRSDMAGYINDPTNPNYNIKGAYLAPDAQCTGPPSSTQFCATSEYESTILQGF